MIKRSALVKISDAKITIARIGRSMYAYPATRRPTYAYPATQRNITRLARFETSKARIYPTHMAFVIRASL